MCSVTLPRPTTPSTFRQVKATSRVATRKPYEHLASTIKQIRRQGQVLRSVASWAVWTFAEVQRNGGATSSSGSLRPEMGISPRREIFRRQGHSQSTRSTRRVAKAGFNVQG
ncbi:unnamed protein product [Didymodactylos carnosus]|uniref:Uncharacterized protein n=1 Tax=Didymodactylos carnosus TaxID=1234261 RepID=A0A8S2YBX1_9BILA|nr:unnamed protein product [Didymodactylos carnosus]